MSRRSSHLDLQQGSIGLAQVLRDLRISREWTLDDLSRQSGISVASLSAYERADRHPPLSTLVRLFDCYDVLLTDALHGVYPYGSWAPKQPH